MAQKRFYWLKLQNDFFKDPRVKKLRRIAGGDTYCCIYLMMLLHSLETDGIIAHQGIENTFAAELALILDEDETNIEVTLSYLLAQGLMEQFDNEYVLKQTINLIGSECESARRVRAMRERANELKPQTQKALKNDVLDEKALHCNAPVTKCNETVTTEIEIELDKEIDLEVAIAPNARAHARESEITSQQERARSKADKFKKPTIDEIASYISEQGYELDAEHFYDHYESNGWYVGKNKMKDWRAAVRNWVRNPLPKTSNKTQNYQKGQLRDEINYAKFGFPMEREIIECELIAHNRTQMGHNSTNAPLVISRQHQIDKTSQNATNEPKNTQRGFR